MSNTPDIYDNSYIPAYSRHFREDYFDIHGKRLDAIKGDNLLPEKGRLVSGIAGAIIFVLLLKGVEHKQMQHGNQEPAGQELVQD